MLLPRDLENLILSYSNVFYPFKSMEVLDKSTIISHHNLMGKLKLAFGPYAWTPSLCNYLRWYPKTGIEGIFLEYSATTSMTPTTKMEMTAYKNSRGFHPIYPGDRYYPTSRVRFDPTFHTNDRYFR